MLEFLMVILLCRTCGLGSPSCGRRTCVECHGQCSHGPLTASATAKPQLEKGSKAMEALTKVDFDKKWLESFIFYVWFK